MTMRIEDDPGYPPESGTADTLHADRIVDLSNLAGRIRAEIAASPLSRYEAGRRTAQAQLDARDVALLAVVLRALVDGSDDTVEFILDGMRPDEVAALGDAGRRLTAVADARTAGTR